MSLSGCRLERQRTRDLEGHFVRVDFVVAAVVERGFHVYYFVAGEHAALKSLANTLIDRLDVFLRNYAADDVILELITLARIRLQLDLGVAVIAGTAGLANELAF